MTDDINSELTPLFDYTEQLKQIITYAEILTGGVIELIWIAKTFLIIYIILGAWRVVRK